MKLDFLDELELGYSLPIVVSPKKFHLIKFIISYKKLPRGRGVSGQKTQIRNPVFPVGITIKVWDTINNFLHFLSKNDFM